MAAEKQINIDLTFNADVSNAKKAMKSLIDDINKLSTSALSNAPLGGFSSDLLKASQAADQLRQNLSSAFNVKTGNLDLVKFNASMKSAGMSLSQYQSSLMALGPAGAQSFAQLSMAIMRADAPLTRVNSKISALGVSLKNTAKWQLSSSILHGFMGSISSAFSYAKNLNSALNDIRIVTGASADEMANFARQANNAAKSLSTSTKTYADAALIFYQQGLGDAEVKERTDAVIKMANVTKDSAAEVSSYMTAIWNNFDDGSKSLEHYADVMTALGAATASSTAEIAAGLEKFASIGKTIGLSYDYATSALATIVANTRQSAEVVGNGLRTIFSRLQGLSLGETLEDGVNLNKYSKALSAVGVSILDATGQMKSMDTILDSLASKWETLSSAQQTALAQTVGGVRQYTTLISLMNNWDDMKTNLNTAGTSTGTLQEQANIYAESWEGARNRVKASAEAIYSSLVNDDFFISLNNGFAGFLDQINNVMDGLGGLKGTLLSLAPIIASVFRGQINNGVRTVAMSLSALTSTGRQNLEKTRTDAVKNVERMYESSNTQSGYAQASHYRQLAGLQNTFYQGKKYMSQEEQQRNQDAIQAYDNVYGGRVRNTSAAVDKAAQATINNRIRNNAVINNAAKSQARQDKANQPNNGNVQQTPTPKEYSAQTAQALNTLGSQAAASGFQRTAFQMITSKVKVDTTDIATAKKQILTLIETLKTAATENGIDLEASGMLETLNKIESEAKQATDSLAGVRSAAAGLEGNSVAQEGAVIEAQASTDDEGNPQGFENVAEKNGMKPEEAKAMGDQTRTDMDAFGASIAENAGAMADAKAAADDLDEKLKGLGKTKVDFSSGFVAASSAIMAVGGALSSVQGLMNVWSDESSTLGDKLITTFTTVGSVALSMGTAFMGANAALLKGIPAAVATAMGYKKVGGSFVQAAAGSEVAKSSFFTTGIVGQISAAMINAGFAPITAVILIIVGALALLIGTFAAVSAIVGAVSDAYNADAIAAEKAAEAARNLASAYGEVKEAYQSMVDSMDQYSSAREQLKTLTQGTEEYANALATANEVGLNMINNNPEFKRGEDYRWENGELIIDETAMKRVKEEKATEVAAARAASLMADAEAAQAKAKAAQTELVRKDDTGNVWKAIGAGAAGGALRGATGGWLGSLIGGVGGAVIGLVGGLAYNSSDNDAEREKIDSLVDDYQTLGEEAFDSERLKALGFDTANQEYIDSLKEVVKATASAADKTSNAARLAAEELLSLNEQYNKIQDEGHKNNVGAAGGRIYETLEDKYYQEYLTAAGDRGLIFNTGTDTSEKAFAEYAELMGLKDYDATDFIGRGDDGSVKYTYTDENGDKQEKTVTVKEMARRLAASKAADEFGKSQENFMNKINDLESSESKADKAISDFLGGDMTQSSSAEWKDLQSEYGFTDGMTDKEIGWLLDKQFGNGTDGKISDETAQKYGYKTAAEMTKAFKEEYNRTMEAWNDISLPAGIGEWSENLSLAAAQKLENIITDLNLGPLGESAGAEFVDGLGKMLKNIKVEDQDTVLNQLMNIDWSSWDAIEQADIILREFGEGLDLTDPYWANFINNMRIASRAIPDFSKMKSELNGVAAVLGSLKLGEAVSEEDYQTLIDYNHAWADFFATQADGSRKFIGNAEEMSKALIDMAKDHQELLQTYSTAAEVTEIAGFDWDRDFIKISDKSSKQDKKTQADQLDKAEQEFNELRWAHQAELDPVLQALGYLNEDGSIAVDWNNAEQVQALFDALAQAIDPTYLDQIDNEFKEMIASTATSLSELQTMLSSEAIDAEAYSKALIVMGSGYEYCTSAVEEYQKAIGTDGEERAREALEAAIEVEEAASKLETAYSNAMSGKSSMTVEDLKTLKENNEELYNSFLTMSDDDWYEAAYQAQVELLEQRMAGYAQESAEYKALMAEKQALDDEYYKNEKEKRQEAYDQFIDNWEKRNNKTQTAIDALSIFEDGTAYGAQSFEAIEKLRQALLDTGKTAEEVDQILNNLGKNKDLDEVETVWAAAQEEARLLLEQAGNNQQAQSDLGMDSNVQLVLTGVENQSSLIKELDNGFQAKGVNTNVSANIVEGTFTSPNGILTYDKDGVYIITKDKDGKEIKVSINDAQAQFKPGGVIVKIGNSWGVRWTTKTNETFTAVIGIKPGQATEGLAYENGKWYVQFSENGETYKAEVGTSLGSFVDGLKCENGKWYIVFSENGETYEAELSVTPGTEVRGLNYKKGKWYVQFSENGETYEAELGIVPGSVTAGLAYDNGKWYIQFSKNGETYTGTINASDLSEGKLTCTDGVWGVNWTANTGEEFTATFKTNPITDENWTKYLESTTNGIQLKMVHRTTGEIMTLTLNQSALAELAKTTNTSSYLKWENGGFVLKTNQASLEIVPVLNTDGTKFSLVNGQLTYQNSDGTTTVAGKDGSYFIVGPDGTATLISADGTILGSINANSGELTEDTVADGTQFVPVDDTGALDLERAGVQSQFGITYMTPGQMAEKYGFMKEASFYTLFDEHNPFQYMDENNLTLFGYMNHPFGGDPGSRNILNNDLTYGALLSFASDHIQDNKGQYYNIARDIFRTQALAALTNRNGDFLGDPKAYASDAEEFMESTMGDLGALTAGPDEGTFGTFKGFGLYDPTGKKWDPSTFGLTNKDATDGIQVIDAGSFNVMSDTIMRKFKSDDGTLLPEVEAYFSGIIDSFKDPKNLKEFTDYLSNIFMDPNIDTQTKMQGYFLAQGLLQACAQTLGEDDPIVQALNALIASMNKALGIASPSRITMQMGRYLAQGLQKGALEEDVDLSPLAEKALTSINKYLLDNTNKMLGVEKMSQALNAMGANVFGKQLVSMSEAWIEYRSTLQPGEVASNTGFHTWATKTKGYTYKDNNYYRPTTEQEYNDYLSTIGMSIQKIDGKYQIFDKDGKALVNKVFDSYDAALTEAIYGIYTEEAMTKYFSKNKDNNFLNYQDDASLTQIQKGLMDTLLDETLEAAFEDTGTVYADWDALVNAVGFDKAMEYLNSAYSKHNVQFLNDTEMVWAQFNDIMVNAVSKQIEIEDKAAKEIVDIWKSAFQAILNARKTMLEGKSFIDDLSDDDLRSMIGQYAAAGMSPEDIRSMMFKTSDQTLPAFNMAYNTPASRSFLDSLLSYNEQGFVTSDPMKQTSTGDFIENADFKAFKEGMEASLTSKIQTGMDEKLYDKLFTNDAFQSALATGNMETIIAAAQAVNPGLTKDEIELIALAAEKDEKTGKYTFDKIDVAAAVDRYITKMYPDLHQTYQDTVTGRVYTDLDYQKTVLNSARASGELYVNQQQEKFDIVSKAREAMLRGEDLQYALTEAEQKELLEITNQSDLTAISLGDLDSASTTLTNTMIICAQQLGIAMGMIERGEATGFSIDPKTGQVTATKAVVNQNEVDKFLTSKQITKDKAGNYYRNGQIITADSNPDLWEEIQNVIQSNTTTTSVPLRGAASNNMGDVLDNAGDGNNDAVRLQYAQEAGYESLQDQDDYIDYLIEESKQAGIKDEADLNREVLAETANDIMEIEKAWQDLYNTQASNIAILNEGRKGTQEYQKALSSLTKTVKKVFGGSTKITEKFVEEHLDLIERMAQGDKDAIEEVEDLLLKEILGQQYDIPVNINIEDVEATDKIGDIIDSFNDLEMVIDGVSQTLGEVQEGTLITPEIDTTGATDALISLLNQGGDTAAGITEALNSIGWTPEIDYEEVDVTSKTDAGGQITYTYEDPSTGIVHTGGILPEGSILSGNKLLLPKINNGATQYKGLRKTGAGTSTTGSRRGGGGGGSRRRYLAKAKPEDHKERYHEINAAIDDVSDALERLNKQQDRAWGSARIKAMQEESKLLREQTDLYRKKAKEVEGYLNGHYDSNGQWVKGDRQRAEEAGWIIDENGRVSNYEERLDDIINDYNAKIMEYNAMSAGEQEALEKLVTEANERFEKGDASAEQYLNPETGVAFGSYEEYLKYTLFEAPQQYLEQYEETMEEWEEQQKLILDNLYAEYDGYVEQIQITAENMLNYIDDQIAYIEHKLSRLEDNAYKTAESIDLIVSKITASEAKLGVAEGELATLLGAHDINVEDFLAGAVSAEDLKNANFTETEIEILREIMSNAQDAEKEMSEGMVEGIESMTSSFEEFNKDLDRYTAAIEHAQSITSTYRNIIDLTGKSLSGFSIELLKAFNDSTVEQAKANMAANKTKYETVQVQYQESLSAWELAQAQYAAGTIEDAAYLAAKSHFEATEDSLREAQEAYTASWEAAIQAVADAYQSTMEGVIEDISKKLANGLTGGLDALQEYMDRAKTADSNYVDDYEKIYQLTKLTRDLESKIDNTQNVKTQKELLKFQKEINDILQSDKQLSEYDIDYLQKKYDLKLAEIALEDAQNAKSQVTMRRDSEGNYNYVYTADENAVAEAEAEYEGKLYEMQKANDEYITSLSDNILSLEQEMLSAIGALDPAQFASQEDYNNRVAEIIDFYTKQMEYQSSEMGKVLANNKSLYDNDMKWYAEYRDYKMADAKTFLDSWDKILLAQVSGFSTQEAFFDNFRTHAGSLAQESLNEYAKWADQIKTINTTAGSSTETLGTDLGKQVEDLTGKAQAAASAMEAHAGKIKTAVEGITGSVSGMLTTFEGKVGDAAKRVDALTGSILTLFKVLGVEGFENLNLDGVLAGLNIKIDDAKNDTPFDNETPGTKLDTGGYTGSWGPEGRLAWLHQKELVLNAHDTANMLASVGILRQIANVIDLNALSSAGGFASLMQTGVHSNKETLQQEVHIEAHFPNATDKDQIEEAFKDIVNLAAQYANSF